MVASFSQGLMLQYTSPVNLHTIILDDSTTIIVTTVTILQTMKLRLRGIIKKTVQDYTASKCQKRNSNLV